MSLTPEQKLIEDMVRKFANNELSPVASDLDKSASFPSDIIKKLASLGFLGIMVPEKYEGAALDPISYCIIVEELSRALGSVGLILVAHNALVSYSILKYGKEEQKKKWLPRLAKGEVIGAFGVVEEEKVGNNLAQIETKAEIVGGEYVLSGSKFFVVNAEVATLFIIFAKIRENKVRAFLVEKGASGFEISEKEEVLGMRASGICNLRIKKVKVREEDILNGNGIEIAQDAFNIANLGVASLGVGICQASLDESLQYSKERHQFGQPICNFQLVQEMLVEMKTRVQQSRLLVREAAIKYNSQESAELDIAIAKLCATESAMVSATKAIQVHGGYGYTKDYPVERYFRDAKVCQIWGGTPIVQKSKIANLLLQ